MGDVKPWEIPAELRNRRRWLRCDGDGVPVSSDGLALMWKNPDFWMFFEEACNATYGDDLGFVLDEGMAVCRLRGVVDDDGELSESAHAALFVYKFGWAEKDPRGRDLLLWGRVDPRQRRSSKSEDLDYFSGTDIRCIPVSGDTVRSGSLWEMGEDLFSRPDSDRPLRAEPGCPASVTHLDRNFLGRENV